MSLDKQRAKLAEQHPDLTADEIDGLLVSKGDMSSWPLILAGAFLLMIGTLLIGTGDGIGAMLGAVLAVVGSAMTLIGCVAEGVFLGTAKARARGL